MIDPGVRIVGLQSCELKVGADGIEIFVARFALSDGTTAATHWTVRSMHEFLTVIDCNRPIGAALQ